MKHLYAPWRGEYHHKSPQDNTAGCPFCIADTQADTDLFILKRFPAVFVMLNRYPYNAGHCMVIPYQHKRELTGLSSKTRQELIEVVTLTQNILKKTLKSAGTNIGINSGGSVAGGSIANHLHVHVVPRFKGDTSFLVTTADTKPISDSLFRLYQTLQTKFSL